jgi:DNA-binding NtrC family response regulator
MKKPARSENKSRNGVHVLFVDDEAAIREVMEMELPRRGHRVTVCADSAAALAALEEDSFDCVISDINMPGMDGFELSRKIRVAHPDLLVMLMTGRSTEEHMLAALREGLFDYLKKPVSMADIDSALTRVEKERQLANRCLALEHQLERAEGGGRLVGRGPQMEQVRQLIAKVAPTPSSVLIRGETGSGKELVARALHKQSTRRDKPFVAVNCGALPETLIESELFGHRKGAFTGADEHRTGLFQVAHTGTIFLDEIGELPKAMQAKLLRVLETGDIRRVGDNQSQQVDVRVICATHRDVEQMVQTGDFREDLMFRINTFEIHLPPLRDRVRDIPELAEYLVRKLRPNLPSEAETFDAETLEHLQAHDWPGNVRELANVVEYALILCDEPPIRMEHLPARFMQRKSAPSKGAKLKIAHATGTLRDMEMQAIYDALERHEGNKMKAAEELGVSLKTLYNKLNAQAQLSQQEKAA